MADDKLPSIDELKSKLKPQINKINAHKNEVGQFQEKIRPLLDDFRAKMRELGLFIPTYKRYPESSRVSSENKKYFVITAFSYWAIGSDSDTELRCVVTTDGLREYAGGVMYVLVDETWHSQHGRLIDILPGKLELKLKNAILVAEGADWWTLED